MNENPRTFLKRLGNLYADAGWPRGVGLFGSGYAAFTENKKPPKKRN